MASFNKDSFTVAAPSAGWDSLVQRSIEAWRQLNPNPPAMAEGFLKGHTSLDGLLRGTPLNLMFWFFQRRDAFLTQKTMTKWSADRLDDYVLLPAFPGFVTRTECFFVSHFWHSKNDPDPGGKYLRLLQEDLREQPWSYIWLDWSCAPQHPRTQNEDAYFLRTLQTMSGIIRNSGFAWFYPPFEPRLWILYEVAEYTLSCEGAYPETEDSRGFVTHVKEMMEVGVSVTLNKYGYRCTYDRDRRFLTSWLELLVLLRKTLLDIDDVRRLLDYLTWHRSAVIYLQTRLSGIVELRRYEGELVVNGTRHAFTPFPKWVGDENGEPSAKPTVQQ